MSTTTLEATVEPDNPEPPAATWIERITVEELLYAAILVLSLIVRWIGLGLRPLSPAEATTALRAWQGSQGLGAVLDAGTPLLLTLETATFFMVGAGDAAARFWPFLASTLLLLAVYRWRDWVGREVALLASALLLFSPLLNSFGRRGDGLALLLLGIAIVVAGIAWLREADERGWTVAAIGLGIIVISGPYAITAFLALLALALVVRPEISDAPSPKLAHLLTFLAVALVGGTVFLTQISGLGLIALNWSEWLYAFEFTAEGLLWGVLRLFLDEPLVVPVGLVALIWGWRRSNVVKAFGAAALVALFVAVLQGPYAGGSRSVAMLFLAVPAATFLIWLVRAADLRGTSPEGWLYAAVFLVLLTLATFALISYSLSGERNQLWLLGATVVMIIILTAVFVFYLDRKRTLSMAALVLITALAVFNFATAWGMGYDPRPPRFPAIYAGDARPGLNDIVATAGDLSERQFGFRRSLPIDLITGSEADDVLHWYLRDFPDLRLVDSVSVESASSLVIAPAGRELALSDVYSGQRFAVLDAWNPAMADLRQQITWALFRNAPYLIPTQDHVLWVDIRTLSLE